MSLNMAQASGLVSPQQTFTTINASIPAPQENDAGITVAGSVSDQKFIQTYAFPTEATTYSLVLKLLGQTDQGQQVTAAVTVSRKQRCTTCNRLNKAIAKFCTECGTSLILV